MVRASAIELATPGAADCVPEESLPIRPIFFADGEAYLGVRLTVGIVIDFGLSPVAGAGLLQDCNIDLKLSSPEADFEIVSGEAERNLGPGDPPATFSFAVTPLRAGELSLTLVVSASPVFGASDSAETIADATYDVGVVVDPVVSELEDFLDSSLAEAEIVFESSDKLRAGRDEVAVLSVTLDPAGGGPPDGLAPDDRIELLAIPSGSLIELMEPEPILLATYDVRLQEWIPLEPMDVPLAPREGRSALLAELDVVLRYDGQLLARTITGELSASTTVTRELRVDEPRAGLLERVDLWTRVLGALSAIAVAWLGIHTWFRKGRSGEGAQLDGPSEPSVRVVGQKMQLRSPLAEGPDDRLRTARVSDGLVGDGAPDDRKDERYGSALDESADRSSAERSVVDLESLRQNGWPDETEPGKSRATD